jgi:hypothetical protein
MSFLTCESIAEWPLPFWVYHAVHFSRIYLLKQGKQCERVLLTWQVSRIVRATVKVQLSHKAISLL